MNHTQTSPRNHQNIDKTEKILALQQELLNVRKQMSKKQSQWQKQRSNLLSKNQVANMQIIQLKQRLTNLSKINQTLTNAMTSNSQLPTPKQKPQLHVNPNLKLKKPKPLIIDDQNSKSNISNDSPNYDSEKKIVRLQEEIKRLSKMISQKDFQISNLNAICGELRAKLDERNSCVSVLEETNYGFKRKVEKQEEQIIKLHKQIHEIEQKLQQNNQYIDQTRRQSQLNKRALHAHQLQSSPQPAKKYTSKNSSYLMIKPTPDHSAFEMQSNSYYHDEGEQQDGETYGNGYDAEEDEKLLCEVCNRVYSFVEFEEHVQYCGYVGRARQRDVSNTKYLFDKKKKIEDQLQRIRLEEEKENNVKNWYRKNEKSCYEIEPESQKDKINQIRQIANGLSANAYKKQNRKNSYNQFSIKGSPHYY